MAIKIDYQITPQKLAPRVIRFFENSGPKILNLNKTWNRSQGTPVFTAKGIYTSRGWTEWTQGFQYGTALLQYDATGSKDFLELGRSHTIQYMAPHLTHIGVHDHGFNNLSTYGNLLRLMLEGKTTFNEPEKEMYVLALKISGAIQAARWTSISNGKGYIYSFNGPHSLFVDTMRSLRSLAVAHMLGHVLMGEKDQKISLLERLLAHAATTAQYSIYYGTGRDFYDVPGRTAHESIFNCNDGSYRCPNSQQGYSPFSTWTRGLAWAILGFAEELEFLAALSKTELAPFGDRSEVLNRLEQPALATAQFYLENSPKCGIPYWDTGAPNLHRLGNWLEQSADPLNGQEPVDSSAAAIAAQGLLRLGNYLMKHTQHPRGRLLRQAGLTVAQTLLNEPYISSNPRHQGLLLHSVYHRPNGWDYMAKGQKIPNGESSMWGDYHMMELGLMLLREARGESPLYFFSCVPGAFCSENS